MGYGRKITLLTSADTQEVVESVVGDLVGVSDRSSYDAAGQLRDYREACSLYCELVYNAVAKSTIKTLHGLEYYFDGRVYRPMSDALFDRVMEVYCKRMGMDGRNSYYSMSRVQKKARESASLNGKLRPSFSVQAFLNGVVDFRDCVLRPFSPEYHVLYVHPYEYDPKARCSRWDAFLREVLEEPESRLILQMFFGLCTYDRGFMTDKVENCLVMYGEGSNGKSTIQEVMRGVLGPENVSNMGLKSLTKGGDEQQRNLGAIDGKVINMGTELNKNDIRGHEDAFKALCSGEHQYGRSIGKDVYKIVNVPWLVFNTNTLLRLDDTSHGVMRRIIWLVFDKIIPVEAQNPRLAADLVSEYPGILNWMVRGAKKLKAARYKFPYSRKSRVFSFREEGENDLVRSWVRARDIRFSSYECDKPGAIGHWFLSSQLYEDLVRYAELNGLTCNVSLKGFGKEIVRVSQRTVQKRRLGNGVHYYLYSLTEDKLANEEPLMESDFDFAKGTNVTEEMYSDIM